MFSSITITRTVRHVFVDHFNLEHPGLFGLKENEIQTDFKADDTTANKAKYGVLD